MISPYQVEFYLMMYFMKANLFPFLVSFLFFFACQKEEVLQTDCSIKAPLAKESLLLIDKETVDLTPNDAQKVALLFQNQDNSRSDRNSEVKSIKTVVGKENTPIAYVVNFRKGFVIVSATKLYNPILAFSDEGTIDDSITSANGWYESIFDIDYGEYAGEFGILCIS